ncbi:hypothetical protein [Streptomyces sp. NBC_01092]|uniref:hypothetical protein n=1 Tax=Streptomyces sp. NBC_01092 TaxID=2903748 RepID=UPI00386E4F88|nr:hypothetical protein OG254_06740 [Streptomyces sp. NBC_01092]
MSQTTTPPPMPEHKPQQPPTRPRTVLLAVAAAVSAAAIAATITASVAAGGDGEAVPAPTVTVTVTTTPAPEADAAEAEEEAGTAVAADFKVGDEASNAGATVKITKVVEGDSITLAGATKKAGAGAKYITLKTVVTNDGTSSMDLTCSLPIVNALIDDQARRFDTIDDLYDVAGNPECNAQLQPGFKDEMQFVYRVPDDATIALWEFSEYNLETETVPTLIDLT